MSESDPTGKGLFDSEAQERIAAEKARELVHMDDSGSFPGSRMIEVSGGMVRLVQDGYGRTHAQLRDEAGNFVDIETRAKDYSRPPELDVEA